MLQGRFWNGWKRELEHNLTLAMMSLGTQVSGRIEQSSAGDLTPIRQKNYFTGRTDMRFYLGNLPDIP